MKRRMHLMPVIVEMWRPKKTEPSWRSKQLCTRGFFFGALYFLRGVVEEGTPLRRGGSSKKKKINIEKEENKDTLQY